MGWVQGAQLPASLTRPRCSASPIAGEMAGAMLMIESSKEKRAKSTKVGTVSIGAPARGRGWSMPPCERKRVLYCESQHNEGPILPKARVVKTQEIPR